MEKKKKSAGASQNPAEQREPTDVLVRAARAGDMDAWRRIDARFRATLALLVRNQVPPEARKRFDEDDLMQSTFLTAFKALDTYESRGQGSFQAWLTTILMHRLQSKLRVQGLPLSDETVGHARSADSTPSELIGSAERKAKLLLALGGLPKHQQQVIVKCCIDLKTHPQAAAELGISVSTVERRLAKGLRSLARELGEAT